VIRLFLEDLIFVLQPVPPSILFSGLAELIKSGAAILKTRGF
jgi:hypothetical protein